MTTRSTIACIAGSNNAQQSLRHRLENDTLGRLLPRGSKRRVFETLAHGDITLRTDGQPYLDGTLWRVELRAPGEFAAALAAGG